MHANKYKYGTIARHFSSNADLLDPNKVKVIINDDNSALEFFRDTPVVVKDFSKLVLHHLGIYAYQVDFLNAFSGLSKTENEISLKLEQMRALDNGLPLHVLELNLDESWGIDNIEIVRTKSVGSRNLPTVSTNAFLAVTPQNDAPELTGTQATLAKGKEDSTYII